MLHKACVVVGNLPDEARSAARLRTIPGVSAMIGGHEESREIRLTLYTKSDCELCHEAKATLLALSQECTFNVVEIDITTDTALYDAFHAEIPVGFLDGQKLFKYRVDPALVRRQIARRRGGILGRWRSIFWPGPS